jgi:hypothetical protein
VKPPVAEEMAQQPVKRTGPHRTPPIPRHPRRILRRSDPAPRIRILPKSPCL